MEMTKRRASKFSAALLPVFGDEGIGGDPEELYLLGLTENVSTRTKIPGGTNEDTPDETSDQVCEREVLEETGFKIRKFKPVHDIEFFEHFKRFYLAIDAFDTCQIDGRSVPPLLVGVERIKKEKDGKILKVRWYTVIDFLNNVLSGPADDPKGGHKYAAYRALVEAAQLSERIKDHLKELAVINSQFCLNHLELIQMLPA
jgi:8-oxo-dGTP pyrophosphatase MutT (NUDIX family)